MQRTVAGILGDKPPEIVGVAPDDTVYEALRRMADRNIGAVVVMDDDRLVGIMSERDYARKVILMDRGSKETRVADIMTSDVFTISPETTVSECMQLMTDHRIRHLPVMAGDRLVGIVSIGDIVKAVIAEQQDLIDQLERYITS